MSSDHDAQNDEMLALESIFDADEFSYRKDNMEFCGQFYAFVSLPDKVKIEYQLLPFPKNRSNVETGDLNQLTVKYLPPVELSFTLPHDYPSTSPPRFTLICSWLGRKQLSELCAKLDSMWEENKGLEILYLWLSFLKEESFGFLKLGTTLNLSKQYSFNMLQMERRKKFQSQASVASSSGSIAVSDSAGTSGATMLPSVQSSKTSSKVSDARMGSPTRGKSRGRGRGRGYSVPRPLGANVETGRSDVGSSMSTDKGDDQISDKANLERKSYNPSLDRRQKPVGAKRSLNSIVTPKFDPRAVSCEALQTSLVSHIMEYNRTLSEREFQRNIYSCQICFEDKPGSQCMEFYGCGHTFCRECVGSYFEVLIKDGNVHGLTCPEKGCESEASQRQISELVGLDLFARYDELLLSSALDKMEDIMYCPRKTCQYPVTYEKDDKMARCAVCSYTFCTLCLMTYHGVEHCRLKMSEGLVAKYEASTSEGKRFLEKKYGSKVIKDLIDTSHSEEWIKGNSKTCPFCSAAIEKSDGCNKMTCWKCNTFFCWICQLRLNPSNPYSHFNSPNSGCFQMLFHGVVDDDDDNEFEDASEDEDGDGEVLRDGEIIPQIPYLL